MQHEISPIVGGGPKQLKDMIISTLTFEHPMNLARLTKAISRSHGAQVTFQGVRKAVMHLTENGVLAKNGRDYEISRDWIIGLREYAEQLHEAYYSESRGIKNIESAGENIKVYTFDNAVDLDEYWNVIITKWFEQSKSMKGQKIYPQYSGHAWYVLANLEEEASIINTMKKYKIGFYIYCPANTPVDKWAKAYYEKQGAHYTWGNNSENTGHYYSIFGDNIIQCEYPKEIVKEIEGIYANATEFNRLDIAKLISALRKKAEYKLTIMRNPVVAKQLREYIMSKFWK